jgi:predicted RND superfamily exporter protein
LTMTVSFALLLFVVIVMSTGIWIFPKIKADTNAITLMKPDNEVRRSIEYIEKHFGAGNVIDFLVTKKDNQPINTNDIKILAETDKQIATLPFIKSVGGYEVWRPFFDRLSATDSLLAKHLRRNFLTENRLDSRITISIPTGSVKEMDAMLHSIQVKVDKVLVNSNGKIEITAVGFLPTYVEQMNTIVDGMLYGLVIAIILILVVMVLLVRDIKLGLITISVTLFPLCGIAILMKLMNIPLDVGTSIISSVAIGMIADDALHIIWNFKKCLHAKEFKGQEVNTLFADSVRMIIFPCTATSVMFSMGFIVLMFSNMITIVEFGLLSTATIILAWISDFFLFPALLKAFYHSRS